MAFNSKELRVLCEDEDTAMARLGALVSPKLHARLADMDAARNVFELVAGNPSVVENDAEKYRIDIVEGWQIIFCSNHVNAPVNAENLINWSQVNRVKILELKNSNESIC